MSDDTTPEDIFVRRALKVLRAAESRAIEFSTGTAKVNSRIMDEFLKSIEVSGNSDTVTQAIKSMGSKLDNETQRLINEMSKEQTEIIRREMAWYTNALDRIREGNLDIPAVIPVPDSSVFDGYDTENPWYRREGAYLFSKNVPADDVVAELGAYYFPKKGNVDFSKNIKLRNKFAAWHRRFLGLDLEIYREMYSGIFNTDTGHPDINSKLVINEFLNQEYPEWNTTYFEDRSVPVAPVVIAAIAKPGIAKSILYAPPRKVMSNMVDRANGVAYQGLLFKDHFDNAFGFERKRITELLREGFLGGKTVDQLTRDVKGVIGQANAQTRTLVRSYYMHNAVEAKEIVYKINPDLVESIRWVSTLDGRTTPLICGIRDGKLYTTAHEPIEHPHLWNSGPGRIHWNCRSTSVPELKGFKTATVPRPSIVAGDNYTRGDNKTSTGRVRKPWKDAREKGIYKTEMRTSRSKYEGWLREQSRKNIDFVADILQSKQRAVDFRDGKLTLAQIERQSPVSGINTNDLSI